MSSDLRRHEVPTIDEIVRRALDEDIGAGDVTSLATIAADALATAAFLVKEDGVLSGTLPASRAFELVDPTISVDWECHDGVTVSKFEVVGSVSGNARSILTAERTALNILQRMSGIATLTSRMAAAASPHGTRVLDTRKTAPGLRMLDKMAVTHGGGVNHRFGLHDMILIKDNHIAACGSISKALAAAKRFRERHADLNLKIEIEARTLGEVKEVVTAWESSGVPDRILLDNMLGRRNDGSIETDILKQAVEMIAGKIETEASGNVSLSTVADIAATGVDFISSGSLTHSVKALDISLEFVLDDRAAS